MEREVRVGEGGGAQASEQQAMRGELREVDGRDKTADRQDAALPEPAVGRCARPLLRCGTGGEGGEGARRGAAHCRPNSPR